MRRANKTGAKDGWEHPKGEGDSHKRINLLKTLMQSLSLVNTSATPLDSSLFHKH